MSSLTINTDPNNSKDDNHDDNNRENTTRLALNDLMQEAANLKAAIETAQVSKRKWRIRDRAVRNNNWKLELQVAKLRNLTDQLDEEIVTKSEESQKSYDDLEIYKSHNKQEFSEFWTHFQEETQKYAKLFTNAHIEYSSDCLKQDIKEYQRESDVVRGKIANVEKAVEDVKNQYGLAELGTNEQANLLEDINNMKKIISDNGPLLQATKSVEDNIEVLKLRVNQKKHDIMYLQNKSCKK